MVAMMAESNRESDWDSVVACHRGLRMVTTWSTQRSTMGKYKLDSERFHHGGQHRHTTAQVLPSLTQANRQLDRHANR